MSDWNGERWGGLGFPKAPSKPITGEGTRERKAVRQRAWKRKHDEKYRQMEREKRRNREKRKQIMCRSCGIQTVWKPRIYCHSCSQRINRSPAWLAQAKLELSTPYHNGSNPDFEDRVQQLDTLHKEQPL
jgi:hypothetical protein